MKVYIISIMKKALYIIAHFYLAIIVMAAGIY